MTQGRPQLLFRRIYEILGLAAGFIFINYGFNFLALGFPGAREYTSQSLSISLLLSGSVAVFVSLYYMFKPTAPQAKAAGSGPSVAVYPAIGVELISDEKDTTSHYGLYRTLEYIGYFFTALGVFSAADLTLQVFIPTLYNEVRWWIEILLVTFGVLSYAIFASIGKLGTTEEPPRLKSMPQPTTQAIASPTTPKITVPSPSDVLEVRLQDFSKSERGEYERHLSETIYDLIRAEKSGVTIWREDRRGIRSIYLAGPYELRWARLEEASQHDEELRIGNLVLPIETVRALLSSRAIAS